jgi:hypothetical protein
VPITQDLASTALYAGRGTAWGGERRGGGGQGARRRAINGHLWFFYGALSSVEYELSVTDTQTGAVREYRSPSGRLASVADMEAF